MCDFRHQDDVFLFKESRRYDAEAIPRASHYSSYVYVQELSKLLEKLVHERSFYVVEPERCVTEVTN